MLHLELHGMYLLLLLHGFPEIARVGCLWTFLIVYSKYAIKNCRRVTFVGLHLTNGDIGTNG